MMQTIRQKVEKVASSGVPILIQGDNGTGKGLLARFIHNRSVAPDAAFVKVNCAAIPGTLLESELFGYEKGAFTGAYSCKAGRVELADGARCFSMGSMKSTCPSRQNCFNCCRTDNSAELVARKTGKSISA